MKGMLARLLVAVALVAVVIAAMSACNGSDPVVFATDGAYHPFNFVNDDGEIDGLERELVARRRAVPPGRAWNVSGSSAIGKRNDPRPHRGGL